MNLLKKYIMVLASAYVLMFFSEYYFVNEEVAFTLIESLNTNPLGTVYLFEFLLYYVFFSYSMLIALDKFKVKTLWGLILAGALFGWWTEGIVISVYYEALPYSILWPSLGWHVIVDVLLGWYFFRRVLHMNKALYTALLSSSLGIFWGLWATWFWVGESQPIKPEDFVVYSFFTSILLMAAYRMMDDYSPEKIKISKIEIYIFLGISIFGFTSLSLSLGLVPLLYFLPVVLITFGGLWLESKPNKKTSIFQGYEDKTKIWQYPILLLIPLLASLVYANVYQTKNPIAFLELVPFLLLIIGGILYLIALIKILSQGLKTKG